MLTPDSLLGGADGPSLRDRRKQGPRFTRSPSEHGIYAAPSTVWHWERGHHVQKKTAHAAEQEREDVLIARRLWFDELAPGDVVIMDNLPAHKFGGYARLSRQPAQASSTCRPTHRTSILPRWLTPRSRRYCAKSPHASSRPLERHRRGHRSLPAK